MVKPIEYVSSRFVPVAHAPTVLQRSREAELCHALGLPARNKGLPRHGCARRGISRYPSDV